MQNIISAYTLSLVILSVFTLAAYLLHIFKRKQPLNIIPIMASIITIYLLYGLIGVMGSANYYNLLALDMCIGIIATIMAILYLTKPYVFVALTILLVAGFMIYASTYAGDAVFAGMFAIGTIYGMMYREFALNPKPSKESKNEKKTEVNRDIVQIILGIIILGIAYLFPYIAAVDIIFGLILLGYLANNLVANLRLGKFYTRAMDLERKGAVYGQGAIYLAAGTALVMGFVGGTSALLFSIIVLFFADSMATIVGVSMRGAEKLPYNRFKTVIGTFTFFVIAAVGGYFTVGLIGILFAFVLAFIESIDIAIDDNVRSGVILVVLKVLTGI